MKEYNSLEEMRKDPSLDPMIMNHCASKIKELQGAFVGETFADFNLSLGGKNYVIENVLELNKLLLTIPRHPETGEYLFDGIEKFGNDQKWFLHAFIATNDAGGPVYYISKELYEGLDNALGQV